MSNKTTPPPVAKSFFKKATKQTAKAKIALTGPSGSGKTLSALLIAKGLGGRCCVIDTENGSASLYAGHRLLDGFEFDVATIEPPYDPKKYLVLIEEAHKAKYDVLIIDSLTHAWAGEGGLLQKKEALDSRGGNSFTNWGTITKEYERLKSYLLHSKVDLIVTMRSKQEYVLEDNGKGKQAPKKVGLAPIMRDGMEYEFTVVFDIGMDHQFMVSKDRTDLFDGVVSIISEDTGMQIKEWLRGESPTPQPDPLPPQEHPPETFDEVPEPEKESQETLPPKNFAPSTNLEMETMFGLCMDRDITEDALKELITEGYNVPYDQIPQWVADDVVKFLSSPDASMEKIGSLTKKMVQSRQRRGAK